MSPVVYLVIAAGAFILLLAGAQWMNNRVTLNHIKSKTVGDGVRPDRVRYEVEVRHYPPR